MYLSQLTNSKSASDPDITGITADSRQVRGGFLFAALPGSKGDGSSYIGDAITHGAGVILAPRGTVLPDDAEDVVLITDENPRRKFAHIAAAYYNRQPETIVAVTGTSGKTSTVSFTQQLWHLNGIKNCASLGTLGTRGPNIRKYGGLTTPDVQALMAELADLSAGGITHLAMEASSHGLDQYRLDGVNLKAAAFTNLSRDHLDYHPDMDHYFTSKVRLFAELLPQDGIAIIPGDDEWGQKLLPLVDRKTIVLGRDIRVNKLEAVPHGQVIGLTAFGKSYHVDLPLVGDFQVRNALTALALAVATGAEVDTSVKHLESLRKIEGRLQLVEGHAEGAGVYVDYAHKPGALETILKTLRPHTQGRLICVFGCGGDRDPGKRPMMGHIASELADVVIVTDDNPRSENPADIRRQILAAAPGAIEIGDRRLAIRDAIGMARAGDVVLIAGKGHETGQIIGDKVEPFDDVVEARNAIEGK